ncbi:MAG: PLP-dependent aminotransferase family protein [Thermoanaerobaculales bacterium]|jgi:DNA-binding transcriptional MocR family regulator|nr:PLP-dependent aminotransferase family protein [Thermoanaerobaculales bacterium]
MMETAGDPRVDREGALDLVIDRTSRDPVYRQLVSQIRSLIEAGSLPEGFRLPPERRLASSLGVNRSTVLAAYRDLKALGLVDAHVGRGTAVLRPPIAAPPRPLTDGVPWRQLFRDSSARARDPMLADLLAMTERSDLISLSIGLPAPELLPLDTLGELAARVVREAGAAPYLHSPTEGHSGLREALAEWLGTRGIPCRPSEVLVVSGSQQGLDLLSRVFIDPGDVVVVEEPSYLGALQTFRAARARILAVPVDEHGMRTDILSTVLEHHRPKLIYTLPTFQNPSGAVLSLDRRRHLLDLAARWQVPVLEDDPYSELRYEGQALPALKALDEHGLVLYLSTFSKVLLPGLRVGYAVLPPVVLRQLVLAKQGVDLHANSFGQYLLAAFMRHGHLAPHIERLRPAYRRRRDAMAAVLASAGRAALRFSLPEGGFYIWCGVPDGVEQSALVAQGLSHGVSFLPGRACCAAEPPMNAVRLNFTHCAEASLVAGVERFAAAVREAAALGPVRRGTAAETAPVV